MVTTRGLRSVFRLDCDPYAVHIVPRRLAKGKVAVPRPWAGWSKNQVHGE